MKQYLIIFSSNWAAFSRQIVCLFIWIGRLLQIPGLSPYLHARSEDQINEREQFRDKTEGFFSLHNLAEHTSDACDFDIISNAWLVRPPCHAEPLCSSSVEHRAHKSQRLRIKRLFELHPCLSCDKSGAVVLISWGFCLIADKWLLRQSPVFPRHESLPSQHPATETSTVYAVRYDTRGGIVWGTPELIKISSFQGVRCRCKTRCRQNEASMSKPQFNFSPCSKVIEKYCKCGGEQRSGAGM